MSFFNLFRRNKNNPTSPAATPYEAIGGEPVVKAIANSFYDIMASDPMARELYALHPQPLDRIRHVFFLYLMMWTGGPDDYQTQFGHPRLRARHLPYTVTPALKAQWMYCMNKAIFLHVADFTLATRLLGALDELATHMINQPGAD